MNIWHTGEMIETISLIYFDVSLHYVSCVNCQITESARTIVHILIVKQNHLLIDVACWFECLTLKRADPWQSQWFTAIRKLSWMSSLVELFDPTVTPLAPWSWPPLIINSNLKTMQCPQTLSKGTAEVNNAIFWTHTVLHNCYPHVKLFKYKVCFVSYNCF